MKFKARVIIFLPLFLHGCGANNDIKKLSKPDIAAPCMACHQLSASMLGPSIEDISAKYNNTDINRLITTVKKGKEIDELTWGSIPMPPSFLSEEDIKKVIEWMLTQ